MSWLWIVEKPYAERNAKHDNGNNIKDNIIHKQTAYALCRIATTKMIVITTVMIRYAMPRGFMVEIISISQC